MYVLLHAGKLWLYKCDFHLVSARMEGSNPESRSHVGPVLTIIFTRMFLFPVTDDTVSL